MVTIYWALTRSSLCQHSGILYSFNSHRNPADWLVLLVPVCREGNIGSESDFCSKSHKLKVRAKNVNKDWLPSEPTILAVGTTHPMWVFIGIACGKMQVGPSSTPLYFQISPKNSGTDHELLFPVECIFWQDKPRPQLVNVFEKFRLWGHMYMSRMPAMIHRVCFCSTLRSGEWYTELDISCWTMSRPQVQYGTPINSKSKKSQC